AAASEQSESQLRECAHELLNHGLLRRRGDNALACSHDRVRHFVLDQLTAEQSEQLCEKLAQALDRHEPHESAERARLWDRTRQPEKALAAHEQAGDSALEKLAFAQAELHYARALELCADTRGARWQRLTMQRAHALSRAGHSARAAQLYKAS